MTTENAAAIASRRSALLTTPRTALAVESLPPNVLLYVKQFEDVVSVEARRLMIGGVPFFEIIRAYPRDYLDGVEEEEAEEGDDVVVYFTGTIVDSSANVWVDLDFEKRVATFAPAPEEAERDQRLTAFIEETFSVDAIEAGAVKQFSAPIPASVEHESDAKGFKVAFEGRTYFVTVSNEGDFYEVLVFDAQGRGLGGSYSAGEEPFDVAEVEVTMPIAHMPAMAKATTGAHDAFEVKAKPKVVF